MSHCRYGEGFEECIPVAALRGTWKTPSPDFPEGVSFMLGLEDQERDVGEE